MRTGNVRDDPLGETEIRRAAVAVVRHQGEQGGQRGCRRLALLGVDGMRFERFWLRSITRRRKQVRASDALTVNTVNQLCD
jgi:hypothetical protein